MTLPSNTHSHTPRSPSPASSVAPTLTSSSSPAGLSVDAAPPESRLDHAAFVHDLPHSRSPAPRCAFAPPTTTAEFDDDRSPDDIARATTWEPPRGLPPDLTPEHREAFMQCVTMLRFYTLTEDTLTHCARTLYPLLVKIGQDWLPERALPACKALKRGEVAGEHQTVLADALDEFLARFPHVATGESPAPERDADSSPQSTAASSADESETEPGSVRLIGTDSDGGDTLNSATTDSESATQPRVAGQRRATATREADNSSTRTLSREQLDAAMLQVVRATPPGQTRMKHLAEALSRHLNLPVRANFVSLLMHRCPEQQRPLRPGSLLRRAYDAAERYVAAGQRPGVDQLILDMRVESTSGARDAAQSALSTNMGWKPHVPDTTSVRGARRGTRVGLSDAAARQLRDYLAQLQEALTAAEIAKQVFGYERRHPGVAAIKHWLSHEPGVAKFDNDRFGRPDAVISAVQPRNTRPGQNLAKDLIKQARDEPEPARLTIQKILDDVRALGLKPPHCRTVVRNLLPYYTPVQPIPRDVQLLTCEFEPRALPRVLKYASKASLRDDLHAWIRAARADDRHISWDRALLEFDTEVLERTWYHKQLGKVERALAMEAASRSTERVDAAAGVKRARSQSTDDSEADDVGSRRNGDHSTRARQGV